MGPGLKIDVREKRFAGTEAPLLRDFRLDVAAGSVVALVGPSGIGKSTLLRMIAGIDLDFAGAIAVGRNAAAAAPPPGYVFQDSRLLPWLSAAENLRAVRPSTTRAEAIELLRRVGLGESADAYPRQLSVGMQRRVGLARALSVNPDLLLLDEPFVSLDRSLIAELVTLCRNLFEARSRTAVLVTHTPEDAAALADRAVILAGRPVRIVADLTFSTPRRERDPAQLAELTADLAVRSVARL